MMILLLTNIGRFNRLGTQLLQKLLELHIPISTNTCNCIALVVVYIYGVAVATFFINMEIDK